MSLNYKVKKHLKFMRLVLLESFLSVLQCAKCCFRGFLHLDKRNVLKETRVRTSVFQQFYHLSERRGTSQTGPLWRRGAVQGKRTD